MANALPWNVRGIDPDIKEQAVEAAQRSGLSVGQWLNQVLAGNLDMEDDEPEAHSPPRRRSRHTGRLDELAERLDRLGTAREADRDRGAGENTQMLELLENAVEAIERIERRQNQPPEAPRGAGPGKIADILAGLEARLEALGRERRGAAAQGTGPEAAALNSEDPAFARVLAEIEARRRRLDGDAAPLIAPVFAPARAPEPAPVAGEGMRERLDLLVSRIDEMRARPVPDTTKLQDRLDEIAGRIAEWRHEGRSDEVATLRRDLAGIAQTIEQLAPERLVGLVEHAVAGVVERAALARGHMLPDRLVAPIERMHEDVQAVLREIVGVRGMDRLSQEVGNLARRLDIIADSASQVGRIDDIVRETEAIKALVGQALRAHPLEGLARQIETLGRQIDQFRTATPGSDRAVIDAIHDVRDRLERIDPAAAFRAIEGRLGAIARMEDKLDELSRGMKSLANGVQPLPQLDQIADRLERIDRALESGKGKPLGGIDKLAARLEAIGTSLDKVAGNRDDAHAGQMLALIEDIGARIDQTQRAPINIPALDAIQGEVARLARRIEDAGASGMGASDMRGIERAISDLFAEFDSTRRDLRDAAETAALRAAQEAVKQAPRDAAQDALAAEGLLLIKRDLGEFKSAQGEAERRMRQTLETLQGTLETLVSRITPLDASRHQPTRDQAPIRESAPDLPGIPGSRSMASTSPAFDIPRSAPTPSGPEPIADLPLEPGLRPGDTIAEPFDPKANFIAAQRAALAAAERDRVAGEDAEKPSRKGVRGIREAAIKAQGGSGGFIVRARKPLLIGIAAVLFSIAALKVVTTRDTDADIPKQPAASAPAKPAATPAEDEPKTTQSSSEKPSVEESQPIPTIGIPADSKRGQRLSETPALLQSDPLTVGSVGTDGVGRPIETGRSAIAALIAETSFKGEDALREAALSGSAAALFEIGSRNADGRGMPRNPQAAARWFEQAAASGHAPSQYRLASLYREGRGVAKDATLAFQWFDRAAAQGHVLAMHNAAVLLAEGVHGAPDYAGAALWFRRAAERGIKDSQFNVAILFARGLGVNQDLGESYRWFAIAAAQGDQDAAKKRDDLAARLTKDQLTKENEKVKTFKAQPASPAANEPGAWSKLAARAGQR
jgi:localization factor PodJL